MSVPEQMPIVEYTANGTTTRFPITFDLHDVGYLNVFINKELAPISSYTVDNFEAVVFATAPNENDEVTLIRDTQLDRETNYQSFDNSFRPAAVNYDFDKIWHVLQEQNLIDGKLLARLKEEIEWRRTHDFNYDELAQVREKQLFDALKGYTDTLVAAVNPGIFQGVIAGVVFAKDGKSVQTHLEEILAQLESHNSDVLTEKERAEAAELALSQKIDQTKNSLSTDILTESNRAKSAEQNLQLQITTSANSIKYFSTLTELTAFVPKEADPKQAYVFETKKNYLWDAASTTWKDEGKSVLDLSEEYTDSQLNIAKLSLNEEIASLKAVTHIVYENQNIFTFIDKEENIVAYIDSDALLHVVGLDEPVQVHLQTMTNEIDILNNTTTTDTQNENAFVFSDNEGNILLNIDNAGKAYFVGLNTDLVSYLKNNSGSIKDTSVALTRSYRDTFTSETQTLLNSLQYAETGAKAPVPLHLFKHNFKTNKTWINDINQITFANSTRLEIDSPYRKNDGVCHPNIIEFWNGFLGYRYIVCITPYFNTNEAEENPCIYGSHDLIHFDLLDGFEQPLDPRPVPAYSTGHNSDNVLTYDPRTGELICIWRQTLRNPNNDGVRTDCLWMRKTKDGKSWTQKERIFINTNHPESNAAGSPAILYDVKSGYWYMYLTRLAPSSTDLRLFRAKKLNENSWEYVGIISTPFTPWHQEVKFVGDKVVMLVYCYPPDNTLYFGIADDFQNFTWSANKYGETSCYKSSFVPEINDQNQLSLKILYSTDAQPSTTSEKWRMYMHQTNFINVNMEII